MGTAKIYQDNNCFDFNCNSDSRSKTCSKMYSSKVVSTDHRDLIHDVAFNFQGTQLATCSSDQTIKVGKSFRLSKSA